MAATIVPARTERPSVQVVIVTVTAATAQLHLLLEIVVQRVAVVAVHKVVRQLLQRRVREAIVQAAVVAAVSIARTTTTTTTGQVVACVRHLLRRRVVRQQSTAQPVLVDRAQVGHGVGEQNVVEALGARFLMPGHEPILDRTGVGTAEPEVVALQ